MAVASAILYFTELTTAQQHYVRNSHTERHPDLCGNMEDIFRNSFMVTELMYMEFTLVRQPLVKGAYTEFLAIRQSVQPLTPGHGQTDRRTIQRTVSATRRRNT
jgi:hypothetical protein